MSKAYEVMTHALATCGPDANVSQVVAIMRDRDIGNVLIVDGAGLRGIVTDRDLALQALTGEEDPRQTPIHKFMNTNVVTGEATWSLEHVAKTMARHQIRRLPIVQDGQLVGIVSLGDVARHAKRKNVALKTLQAISTPVDQSSPSKIKRAIAMLRFAMTAFGITMMACLAWKYYGLASYKQKSAR
jgi:CBS domain-containing protein